MTTQDLLPIAKAKGYKPTEGPEYAVEAAKIQLMLKWLREQHYIYIWARPESIGSDEWTYVYEIKWLPKEHREEKRRCPHFKHYESFKHSGGPTYEGGWDSMEEAIAGGILKALGLIIPEL